MGRGSYRWRWGLAERDNLRVVYERCACVVRELLASCTREYQGTVQARPLARSRWGGFARTLQSMDGMGMTTDAVALDPGLSMGRSGRADSALTVPASAVGRARIVSEASSRRSSLRGAAVVDEVVGEMEHHEVIEEVDQSARRISKLLALGKAKLRTLSVSTFTVTAGMHMGPPQQEQQPPPLPGRGVCEACGAAARRRRLRRLVGGIEMPPIMPRLHDAVPEYGTMQRRAESMSAMRGTKECPHVLAERKRQREVDRHRKALRRGQRRQQRQQQQQQQQEEAGAGTGLTGGTFLPPVAPRAGANFVGTPQVPSPLRPAAAAAGALQLQAGESSPSLARFERRKTNMQMQSAERAVMGAPVRYRRRHQRSTTRQRALPKRE